MRNVSLQTYGVCFLGTPHRGSLASIGKLALQSMKNHNRKLLYLAEKASAENPFRINEEFLNLLSREFIQICSFYEEKATRSIGLVVPKASAVIGLATEVVISLATDHTNMTKFSSENDVGFIRVRSLLQRWVTDIKIQTQLPKDFEDSPHGRCPVKAITVKDAKTRNRTPCQLARFLNAEPPQKYCRSRLRDLRVGI